MSQSGLTKPFPRGEFGQAAAPLASGRGRDGAKREMRSAADVSDVFFAFLRLGLTAFGGPVAHLAYFRQAFVARRAWLTEPEYADLVALCQFLPGPASSQVGFAIGLRRAGLAGALAAWCGFTLPSALLMAALGLGAGALSGRVGEALVHGLKLVAVAVVAHALWGMAASLAPDLRRRAVAAAAGLTALLLAGPLVQAAAIGLGAVLGALVLKPQAIEPAADAQGLRVHAPAWAWAALTIFVLLLALLPLCATMTGDQRIALFDSFYRAGALVFGGGHVVLPLLEAETVGQGRVSAETFLAGYGAAQAVPGPLFTFAAFLGAADGLAGGWGGAAIALVAIFLPGLLLAAGVAPFWAGLRDRSWARAPLMGANAAVVGLLAAALIDPVITSAITGPLDGVISLAGFLALQRLRAPALAVVAGVAVAGMAVRLAAGL